MKRFFFFILLRCFVATPNINLYFTGSVNENDHLTPHDCLRVSANIDESNLNRQIISYCLTESLPSNYIQSNHYFQKITFEQLSKQNITSQQLYYWSATVDLIEEYQLYLNQLSLSNNSSLSKEIYYNCTLPRFGTNCEYELIYYHSTYSSLHKLIYDYYNSYDYDPTNLTCYTYIECNRGPEPSCLDWSEICDGKIDCYDNKLDEEYCWQLEINECNDNEYRCSSGQCIPMSFYFDDYQTPDCLDQSDEHPYNYQLDDKCEPGEPSFGCEERICKDQSLTSSCLRKRTDLLIHALYSVKDNSISDECWFAFKCITRMPEPIDSTCYDLYQDQMSLRMIDEYCPEMVFIPAAPVLFNDIYFAYTKNDTKYLYDTLLWSPYTCFNNSRYNEYFINHSKVIYNNLTCYRPYDLPPTYWTVIPMWTAHYVFPVYMSLNKYNLLMNYTSLICNRSNMYQCINSSKCISIYRLVDGKIDCPYNDDEDINQITDIHVKQYIIEKSYHCQKSKKYISYLLIGNRNCDCGFIERDWCEDENIDMKYIRWNISFQTICDGYTELLPIMIGGKNHTDETECQQWLCDNIYTHCNGLWQCPNGEDEMNCYLFSSFNCSSNHHLCVSPDTNQLTCLSFERINDEIIDCLGAIDEPNLCYDEYIASYTNKFKCRHNCASDTVRAYDLCNNVSDCIHGGDDEQFCNKDRIVLKDERVCFLANLSMLTDVEQFLCNIAKDREKKPIIYFSLDTNQNLAEDQTETTKNMQVSKLPLIDKSQQLELHCHRGFPLRLWSNTNSTSTLICLCPPSYYGDQCQYQNQRVSLSLQFCASSNSWQMPFSIIISLIDNTDDEKIIHSYEQFSYLSSRDCKIKFNIYLFYSPKPKNQSKSYFIHVDIYEKLSLNYRGSLLYPIHFSFLPVHRLAFMIDIPRDNNTIETCSNFDCNNHGKCLQYSNQPNNISFCQCDEGWTGKYCTILYKCRCSSDSKCIGITNSNRSICVCPLDRFGPRCLMIDNVCQKNRSSPCKNNGQCIPNDEYMESDQKYVCICPKGFIGKHCEIIDNRITFVFHRDINLGESIFIHFIRVMNNDRPQRATTFKTIVPNQKSVVVYWSQPFHLVFIELSKKTYYLGIVQKNYEQSKSLNKTIDSTDRCLHINELFNESIVNLHLLRRIKYYQLPCQRKDINLSCFYDDIHMCLCQQHGERRVSNCFEFNHNMTFDCSGQNVCENDGQCFQDTPNCPQRFICICPPCFYGIRCQFSTSGFRISLDAILGYHIQPYVNFSKQSSLVQLCAALVIIFILIGLMNAIFALITFRNKTICQVGCGIYLSCTSISTLLTTCMFGLKFWILVIAQMGTITNRSFLSFQCHSIDFLLRIGLNMDQWLNTCVAMERAYTVIRGTKFNKNKSKQTAKFVVIILLIIIIGTNLPDPIHRHLIDEENEDEKRIWCTVSYPSQLQTFTYVMTILHFIVPFLLTLISAIILIIIKSRQKSNIQTQQNYNELLREQFREHKNLFISPVILVILSLPHLILSFVSKCMKSSNHSWLYLTGYFISFIPPMLTFIIFILPSKFYKKEFKKTILTYRTNIQNFLRVNS